jgi:hypothetical protein
MSFFSFLRLLGARRPRRPSQARTRPARRGKKPLTLEALESRVVPSGDTPTIVATKILPLDGSSSTSTHPPLQVVFSEPMVGTNGVGGANGSGAADSFNYALIGSDGTPVTIDSATLDATKTTVTLGYNGGAPLVTDHFTLFVRGNNLRDADDGRALSGPGQLLVADGSTNSISSVNLLGNGSVGATSGIPLQDIFGLGPAPAAVTLADVEGTGIPDLIVGDNPSFGIYIYRGHSAAQGGGFSTSPDLILNLPPGGGIGAQGLLAVDLNGDGKLDLVATDPGTNQVTVYLNRRTSVGELNFGPGPFGQQTDYTVAPVSVSPVDVIAVDINGDGFPDLVTANHVAGNDLNGDNTNDYSISVLMNDGTGKFGKATQFRVGDVAPAGVTAPTGLAAGLLHNSTKPDIVVSGGNGFLGYLLNQTTTGSSTPAFAAVQLIASPVTNTTAVAVGKVTTSPVPSVVAASNGGVVVFTDSGGANPTFTASPVFATSSTGTAIALGDINGDGLSEVISSGGTVSVLLNTSTSTTPSFATHYDYKVGNSQGVALSFTSAGLVNLLAAADPTASDVNVLTSTQTRGTVLTGAVTNASNTAPIVVTSPNHGLSSGAIVTIQGVQGNTAANSTFQITKVDANSFSLNGSQGNGTYLTGGTWVSPNDFFSVANPVPITPASSTPDAIAVGDLNNDGLPDYVFALKNANKIGIVLSNGVDGTGRPTYAAPLYVSVGNTPVSIAIGDLNNDGLPDIVVANQQDSTVTVLINQGGSKPGTAYTSSTVAVGKNPTQVVLGDFNNDGLLDLAVAHNLTGGPPTNRGVSVILSNAVANPTAPFSGQAVSEYLSGTEASALAVADFNHDGNQDLVVGTDTNPGTVKLLLGNGTGGFTNAGSFNTAVSNISSLAVADFNMDGFPDVVVASKSTDTSAGGVAVLLNQVGTGFGSPIQTNFLPGTGLTSVVVTNLNQNVPGAPLDGFPDILVSTLPGTGGDKTDNVYALIGNGDGTFQKAVPYQVGQAAGATGPSYLAVTPGPLVRVTTFKSGGQIVKTDLIANGSFERRDLTDQAGNLLGWQTFNLALGTGSHGQWGPQTGSTSPLSGVAVPPPPDGQFQAMLDQQDLTPIDPTGLNSNTALSYAGSHALYQDVTIPAGATSAKLTFTLYIDNTGSNGFWSDTTNTNLDFRTANNQQVRVDLMNPNDPSQNPNNPNANLLATTGSGFYQNLYTTRTTDPSVITFTTTIDLSAFIGTTIRLRFAAANNQGKLIVGVDNVHLNVQFNDTQAPTLSGVVLRNPGFLGAPGTATPHTNDPTVVGQVGDIGGLKNLAYVAFDVNNDGDFNGPDDVKTTTWDGQGHFSFTIPNLTPGLHTVGVQVADNAGNVTKTTLTFFMESASLTDWQAFGPSAIDVTAQGVNYKTVSGRVTSIAVDPRDPTGNSYYIGSANGGVWRTTNGGNDWTPLMDYITDGSGNPLPAPIGGLAVAPSNPIMIYAGTGVADTAPDSNAGVGVFLSIDGGNTWKLSGDSGVVLAGARISGVVVDANNASVVYVAVASGGMGPGIYKLVNVIPGNPFSGNWVNTMTPASMGLPAGTALPSVTDLKMDPFNSQRLIVGLGNIGLLPASDAAGLWRSSNGGGNWDQPLGGDGGIPNSTLPSGAGVGRVTVALAGGRVGDEGTAYVLIGSPPVNTTAPNVNAGDFVGLYKTSNNFLDYTKVMLRQAEPAPVPPMGHRPLHNFQDIDLLYQDASYAGALAVDPTDPNVVYVGGSSRWAPSDLRFASNLDHGLIRVDTGNMLDASHRDLVTLALTNSGDDLNKKAAAEAQPKVADWNFYDPPPPPASGVATDIDPYKGEGVYWYDIEQMSPSAPGSVQALPTVFHALVFDSLGRLLIGTDGGLWRAVNFGYGYDFTSGGRGIIPGVGVNPPGPTLTALNGNLQIADLTSVAIDPSSRNVLYTTESGTGTAASTAPLQWVSQGLVGPAIGTGGQFPTPTAAHVLVGSLPPGAPPGMPTTIYRNWEYAISSQALQPESSSDGGLTYNPAGGSLPVNANNGAAFPAFAINPTKPFDTVHNVFYDELLLGTNKVFLTRTNSNVWDPVGSASQPLSPTGGLVSALAFAPSRSGLYFAGTDHGEVFVIDNAAAPPAVPSWVEIDAGLPAAFRTGPNYVKVNGITVDPNNPNVVYVMFASNGGNSVWRTTDFGATWTNISSSLPPFPAYALVVDPRTLGGAPMGRLYVATQVGVFQSLDNAATWQRLGQGLPNVPVVSLQFNQNLEELAAGTQGRGAFTISTARIGPHVTAIGSTPGVPAVTLTFNVSINPATLTAGALTLNGPGGKITPTSIIDVDPQNQNVFQINFPAGSAPGSYDLTLQPTVTDLVGNPMDQNQNGINGEIPGDIYIGRFLYQPTTPNTAPVLNTTFVQFPTLTENPPANPGEDLPTFVAGLNITDPDPGALKGIAVDFVDNRFGQWQFSTDGGTTWTNFGTPTANAARLLEGAARNRIRFVPNLNYFSTSDPSTLPYFTFHAWDLTSGLNPANGADGGVGPDTPGGGSSAYSFAFGTVVLTVLQVNQPPTFAIGPNQAVLENAGPQTVPHWITTFSPGPPNEAGQTVTFIVTAANPAMFAVQPAVGPDGTLTYTPAPNVAGLAVVSVQAHDNGGTANGGRDTSDPQTFIINIVGVNQPPSFTVGPNQSVSRDAGNVVVPQWAKNISAGPANEAGQAVNFIVTAARPDMFAVQPAVLPDGTLSYTPSGIAGTTVVTVVAHDNGGTANGGRDTSAPKTFTITVSGMAFHGTPNEVWVVSAFLDLLHRPVSTAELTFWTDQLESDVPRATVAQQLLNSTEYRTKLIQQQFQTLLGRPAGASDLNTYLNLFLQGVSDEAVKALIISSPEYVFHRGVTSPGTWVNAVYQDVLGHTADGNAQNYWGQQFQQTSPYQAALGIMQSQEASGTVVRHLYENLLGRDPQANEGVNPWYVELQQGVRDESVTASIAASDEYFTRQMPNFNEIQMQNWLTQAYKDVLGRPIDDGGQGIWMKALNHGLSRQFVVRSIVNGQEFQTHEINQIYLGLLHRPADTQGQNIALNALAQGNTVEQIKAVLMGSSEYYFGRGGGTAFGFLNAVYNDALGRPLDGPGAAYWGGLLASGMDRGALALQLLQSTDAEKVVVQNYYTQVLLRSADPSGQAYWAGQVQAGLPDAYVLAGLVASREYYNRFPNH